MTVSLEETRKHVCDELARAEEAGVTALLTKCLSLIECAFEEGVPIVTRATTVVAVEEKMDSINQEWLGDEEKKAYRDVKAHICEILQKDMDAMDENGTPDLSDQENIDLFTLALEKSEAILHEDDLPIRLRAIVIEQGLHNVTDCIDVICMGEDCSPEIEEACDALLLRVARIRRDLMRLQDQENEKDYTLDSTMFKGYDDKNTTTFKSFL